MVALQRQGFVNQMRDCFRFQRIPEKHVVSSVAYIDVDGQYLRYEASSCFRFVSLDASD
jgi:hypothetical protein